MACCKQQDTKEIAEQGDQRKDHASVEAYVENPPTDHRDMIVERLGCLCECGDLPVCVGGVEEWVKGTRAGKEWLERMAAEVGVPLQIALPFGTNEYGKDEVR